MKTKKKKLLIILKNFKKIIKPHQIVFLIILLAGNTYAWFVYSSKVSTSIDVHVRAWNVLFQSGQTSVSDYFNVTVSSVYPGMTDFTDTLTIENASEVAADITYKILEARIFSTTYITEEGRIDAGNPIQQDDMTSAQLETKLANDYPFTITFALSSSSLSEVINNATSTSNFTVTVHWPYESGDDDADTYWGKEAYTYYSTYQNTPGITLTVKVYVNQSA